MLKLRTARFTPFLLFLLTFIFDFAQAQDPAAMAAQQAQQAAQQAEQANQRAIQSMQESNERINEQMRNMNNASQDSTPAIVYAQPPIFSVKSGTIAPGRSVRIKSKTHYATIYYTTNGWRPTVYSNRYLGPIPINGDLHLQAIAVAPNMAPSMVVSTVYSVPGAKSMPVVTPPLTTDGTLRAGTQLTFVTSGTASSKTAQVGDSLKLQLDQDVKVGDAILVPKGTPVDAVITLADRAGHLGAPGDLAFEVHSLRVGATEIPLNGGESIEGSNHYGRAASLFFIPVVGLAGLAARGGDAEITPGMALTADVTSDTPLQP